MNSIVPSSDATAIAVSLGELLEARAPAQISDDYFAADWSPLWTELDDAGWLDLGKELSQYGSDHYAVIEMVPALEIWGKRLVPLPFAEGCISRMTGQSGVAVGVRAGTGTWTAFADRLAGAPSRNLAPLDIDDFAPSKTFAEYPESDLIIGDPTNSLLTLWGAEGVGCAAAALERAVEYAGQRQAYGRLIGTFQAIRHLLADMYRDVELARTAVYWAASQSEVQQTVVAYALRLARAVICGAIQTLGGMGFTWDGGLHFYLRHVMALESRLRVLAPYDGAEAIA